MARYCALIPGVTGVVGRGLARYLATQPEWEIIGLARRTPSIQPQYRVISIDIADGAACRSALRALRHITHIFYCARATHSASAKEPIELNAAMLRNLMDAVEPAAPDLRHVHLLQGSKYYGSDLGPYKTPAKESDPRIAENNWYYEQQDFIAARSRNRLWHWSASRPHAICDDDVSIVRSIHRVIGVYAAIMKELGKPLHFPGTALNFNALYQCVDATLLAKAIVFMSTHAACENQAFNVTNGDFIRWVNLWPRFAAFFGMENGAVKTMRLAQTMVDKAPVWERIVAKHALQPTPYTEAALWPYGDFVFMPEYDIMSDTLKLRRAGFNECMDTEEMFLRLLTRMREARALP